MTLRQLQWWDERGVVSPHHEQHRRIYRSKDVVEILVMSELRRKGVSLQKIRWSLAQFRRAFDLTAVEENLFLVMGISSQLPLFL